MNSISRAVPEVALQAIRQLINERGFGPGDALPSQRDLAVQLINKVRERAAKPGMTAAMDITIADLDAGGIDFILDERARELTGETTRWFDLKRTGKLVERVKLYNAEAKNNIKDFHLLRPIPNQEILLSTGSMKQNPGY